MVRAKGIYILIIKVNKVISFFSSRCFLKEIENMYFVFLSSYRNTRESLGELEKAVKTLACGSCFHSISSFPKLPLVFLYLDRNTVHVFYFLLLGDWLQYSPENPFLQRQTQLFLSYWDTQVPLFWQGQLLHGDWERKRDTKLAVSNAVIQPRKPGYKNSKIR